MRTIRNPVNHIVNETVAGGRISVDFLRRFGNANIGVFDIETLGLSPQYFPVILAGLIRVNFKEACGEEVLIFAEKPHEEKRLLEELMKQMDSLDIIVTYNGASFDVPYIKKRAAKYGIATDKLPWNMDLLPLVKKYTDIGSKTVNLKQKTLEAFMGLWQHRADEVSGGDLISLYESAEPTESEKGLTEEEAAEKKEPGEREITKNQELILLHNSDDIRQLCRLLAVTGEMNLERALFGYGFPLKGGGAVEKISLKTKGGEGRFIVKGKQGERKRTWIDFEEPVPFELFANGGFELSASIHERGGVLFADLCEIGFSPEEIDRIDDLAETSGKSGSTEKERSEFKSTGEKANEFGSTEKSEAEEKHICGVYEGCTVLATEGGKKLEYGNCNILAQLLAERIMDI